MEFTKLFISNQFVNHYFKEAKDLLITLSQFLYYKVLNV